MFKRILCLVISLLLILNPCLSYAASTSTTTIYVGNLYEKAGSTKTKHIFLGNVRVASVVGSAVQYFHSDHIGSANVLTDSNGAILQRLEYDPFGKIALNSGTNKTDYKFTGKELDEETELYYFGARYYFPLIGRFLTPDTIVQAPSDPQSLNRYTYCRNNPVNLIDPTGHFGIFSAIFAIVKAITAAVTAVASYVAANAAVIATGAVIGGAVGGISSVAMGGNFWQGMGYGALGGAVFAGLTPAFSGMMKGILCGT
ncbi:MAG: RHS repeat domain-containing protein, partial [Candidatus Omnitrophota bacterium]